MIHGTVDTIEGHYDVRGGELTVEMHTEYQRVRRWRWIPFFTKEEPFEVVDGYKIAGATIVGYPGKRDIEIKFDNQGTTSVGALFASDRDAHKP